MSEELYTLKEMAKILGTAFKEEEPDVCARKIRHWTLMDLLSPHGKKHTGTGKSRLYSIQEIYKAAILMELTRWKVPLPVLTDSFDIMLDSHEDGKEWTMAVEGTANVFLALVRTDELINWQMSAHEPKISYLTHENDPNSEDYLQGKIGSDDDPYCFDWPTSAIVMNITRIFKRLEIDQSG